MKRTISVEISPPTFDLSSYESILSPTVSGPHETPTMNGTSESEHTGAFKTRPRHAKSPYFPARRRSQRLSKNVTSTQEDEEPAIDRDNVNSNGENAVAEKEDGHPPQSQSNGHARRRSGRPSRNATKNTTQENDEPEADGKHVVNGDRNDIVEEKGNDHLPQSQDTGYARRRSGRLSKNTTRSITQGDEQSETDRNHIANGDGKDIVEDKENAYPRQSQANGHTRRRSGRPSKNSTKNTTQRDEELETDRNHVVSGNGKDIAEEKENEHPQSQRNGYARRRSGHHSKNSARSITQEDQETEANRNHVVNGNRNKVEEENGHQSQSEVNGYEDGNDQMDDDIPEEDILLASIEPDARDQLLQIIASHPFLRQGRYPVRKSERKSFTEDLRKYAREMRLDEGAFDGLMQYVRRTYLELYANVSSALDVTADGSEFGDEIDDEAEDVQKETEGGRKRKRESAEQPNVTTRGRKKARPSDEGDYDSRQSSASTRNRVMAVDNYQEMESVSIPSGTPNLGTPSLGTPIRGTPVPATLLRENYQEIDSGSVPNGTPAQTDNPVAYEAHPTNYDRTEDMNNTESYQAPGTTESVELPIPQEEGDAVNPQTEVGQAEDVQMEDTQTGGTQAEDVHLEDARMDDDGTQVHDTRLESTQVEDTQAEGTQPENTQAENTQAEDTPAEDNQVQDTQMEDTQKQNTEEEDTQVVDSIRTENISAENSREEVTPAVDAQAEPTEATHTQTEGIQAEARYAEGPQEDIYATAEENYPKDGQAEDTQAEDTSEWEELPSTLENLESSKTNESLQVPEPPRYHSPGQSASAMPNPERPNALEKSPQKTLDKSTKQPSARTARNYRKRVFRRRRIAQRKREIAELKSQQSSTHNHAPTETGKDATEGNPNGVAENNMGFTQQGF